MSLPDFDDELHRPDPLVPPEATLRRERLPKPRRGRLTTPPAEESTPPAQPAAEDKAPRLRALDAFRGLTIALMLLVNNIALDVATPKTLTHAAWNQGVNLADLVLPWFLLAAGVAIPFAAASARRKGIPAWRFDLKVLSRAGTLVLLGCLVDSSVLRTPVFTLGVLQIIGLAYLVAALLVELPTSRRLLIAGGLLAGYWAAIKFLPIPGIGTGIFEDGRNFIQYLNVNYFNGVHLWGLPSVVPTAALVIIGSALGDVLRNREWVKTKQLALLLVGGVAMLLLGLMWNLSLPFNKPVWTPAYVLYTAGLGTLLLGALYLVIDVAGWWHWSYPLLVFGANSIILYVASILTRTLILEQWHMKYQGHLATVEEWLLATLKGHYGNIHGGWLFTLGIMAFWWIILWLLYRKKVFIRV
ncbi:MAG TPA: heparan-alpha-glucosaminide N-acetyltransferase domain-containing protein [Armatimonadota bacterium]